jgi:hypothetical protein
LCEERFPEDAVWVLLVFAPLDPVATDLVAADFVDVDFVAPPGVFAVVLWCVVEVVAAVAGLADVESPVEL